MKLMVGEENLTFQLYTMIWEWVLRQLNQNGGMTKLSTNNSSIKLTFQTCVFNKMQTLPLRRSNGGQMSNSKRWSKIGDYGISFGCFHHSNGTLEDYKIYC
jgi:hypothetical protein